MKATKQSAGRIRVLFPYVGDSVGGAQVSGTALIENLDRDLYEAVLVLHEEGPFSEYLDERKIEYRTLPLSKYLGQRSGIVNHAIALIVTVPTLLSYLVRNRIGIVHGQDGRMNLTWMLPAKLAGVPFIWHQRSKFSQSRLSALGARFATHVVSISDYTFSTLPARLRSKSSVIENPVELSGPLPDRGNSRTSLCRDLNIEPMTPIVGFFGNLTDQKRPHTFIKIAAELGGSEENPPVFVLFGADRDGLKPKLQNFVNSLGIGDRVIFKDFVNNPEHWMAGCDVVLAPGVEDAFGRSVAEAMLVGTPVVASRSGGHEKIIRDGETGYLVAPDDVTAFAEAVRNVLDDVEATRSISQNASKDASSRFSAASHVANVMNVYGAALSKVSP